MFENKNQFEDLTGQEGAPKEGQEQHEQENVEHTEKPIQESEDAVSYLGVELPKAENTESQFVPNPDNYREYINDRFALELQQKLAVAFASGDPVLVEGGTSIGKTTTVRKMCADLGWEVHYANLNGATDVEDLMGRYIPNPNKTGEGDPEYIFADGKVTSGLRQEEGKTKVIILDELNAARPNILIRLHEVLDALERGEDVVLAEDASETVDTNKETTKVVALMNPPGRGYLGREPLDPAQLRRWVYQKEVTQLPEETFSYATDALFGVGAEEAVSSENILLRSRQEGLSPEQLQEIPGIEDILEKYKEFHKAAKNLLEDRKIAEDQPQPFSFDDRMEPARVRNFVMRFYDGDITNVFQQALRYYYANKLEKEEDRQKLEELIAHVIYVPDSSSKRKGLEEQKEAQSSQLDSREKMSGPTFEQVKQAEAILGKENVVGPEAINSALSIELTKEDIPEIPFSEAELERAAELGQMLVLRLDKGPDGTAYTMENLDTILTERFTAKKTGKSALNTTKSWRDVMGDEYFTTTTPQRGWALVSKEPVADTTGKNYIEQTDALINHLKEEVFSSVELPDPYKKAIQEFEDQKDELEELMSTDWKKAAERLAELTITTLTRQTIVEVLYDLMLHYDDTGERLLGNTYTWTADRSVDGSLVNAGGFDSEGVDGGRWGRTAAAPTGVRFFPAGCNLEMWCFGFLPAKHLVQRCLAQCVFYVY